MFKVYFMYIINWIFWIFGLVIRLPKFLLNYFDPNTIKRKRLYVYTRILKDKNGNPVISEKDVNKKLDYTKKILNKYNIDLINIGYFHTFYYKDYFDSINCEFSGIFSKWFIWFFENSYKQKSTICIYFVSNINSFVGCSFPGTNWIIVKNKSNESTIIHEIGHLCDLWFHSDKPKNIMNSPSTGSDNLTRFQYSIIRSSRFATYG